MTRIDQHSAGEQPAVIEEPDAGDEHLFQSPRKLVSLTIVLALLGTLLVWFLNWYSIQVLQHITSPRG